MTRRIVFRQRWIAYLLVAPQLAVTFVFFVWPAGEALFSSMQVQDPFGLSTRFVWFENFKALVVDPSYMNSIRVTVVFSLAVTLIALAAGLLLAVMTEEVRHGALVYRTLLIWPYAVAPAIAGVLWLFLFDPTVGIVAWALGRVGIDWNHRLNGNQALLLVVMASAWRQISYNFLFFVAGLQAIPKALIEAAALDGAGPGKRFWAIVFPLLSPTTFFLLVVDIVYAFFETFGTIHAVTAGGPAQATTTMVYKVFVDGFVGLDLGGSAAQSVVLMAVVIVLTVIQFRFVERRVQYR